MVLVFTNISTYEWGSGMQFICKSRTYTDDKDKRDTMDINLYAFSINLKAILMAII